MDPTQHKDGASANPKESTMLFQGDQTLEEYVEFYLVLFQDVSWFQDVNWDEENLKMQFLRGLEDPLAQILLLDDIDLPLIKFIDRTLWVCGSSLTVGDVQPDLHVQQDLRVQPDLHVQPDLPLIGPAEPDPSFAAAPPRSRKRRKKTSCIPQILEATPEQSALHVCSVEIEETTLSLYVAAIMCVWAAHASLSATSAPSAPESHVSTLSSAEPATESVMPPEPESVLPAERSPSVSALHSPESSLAHLQLLSPEYNHLHLFTISSLISNLYKNTHHSPSSLSSLQQEQTMIRCLLNL
ncbi:hypothetical protein PO909_008334 [Leuciscus waleckii]